MNKALMVSIVALFAIVMVGCTKKVKVDVVQQPTGDVVDVVEPTETETGDVNDNLSGSVAVAIDTGASVVNWAGERIVGNAHSGTVQIETGFALVKDDMIVGGEAVIAMATIVGDNEKAVGHLKTADFFDVEAFPTSKIVITDVTTNDSGAIIATADLTIKGVTNEIEFPIVVGDNGQWMMDITIDRTLWGIKYDSGKFFSEIGDKAIRDEITFDITLGLVK
ncbi:YceI family protein [Patescibacteria group bacterium]|nr:YceI family protein [Patescibacteria group bacterium]